MSVTLTVVAATWDERVRADLRHALDHDTLTLADVAAAVARGDMRALALFRDGVRFGSLVIRGEHDANGAPLELVPIAVGPRTPGAHFTRRFLPFLDVIARQCGYPAVRVHTIKPGLGRLMAAQGYNLSEFVYRKAVNVRA